MVLGVVLKSARLEKGLSQAALAKKCGLQRAYVASIERGEKAITVETANRVAAAMGMTLVALFQRVEEATNL